MILRYMTNVIKKCKHIDLWYHMVYNTLIMVLGIEINVPN